MCINSYMSTNKQKQTTSISMYITYRCIYIYMHTHLCICSLTNLKFYDVYTYKRHIFVKLLICMYFERSF